MGITLVQKYEAIALRWGMATAYDRATTCIAGALLGREFGETGEAFFERKPELKELRLWLESI
jgi:hypothetical protein